MVYNGLMRKKTYVHVCLNVWKLCNYLEKIYIYSIYIYIHTTIGLRVLSSKTTSELNMKIRMIPPMSQKPSSKSMLPLPSVKKDTGKTSPRAYPQTLNKSNVSIHYMGPGDGGECGGNSWKHETRFF